MQTAMHYLVTPEKHERQSERGKSAAVSALLNCERIPHLPNGPSQL